MFPKLPQPMTPLEQQQAEVMMKLVPSGKEVVHKRGVTPRAEWKANTKQYALSEQQAMCTAEQWCRLHAHPVMYLGYRHVCTREIDSRNSLLWLTPASSDMS